MMKLGIGTATLEGQTKCDLTGEQSTVAIRKNGRKSQTWVNFV